MDPSAKMEPSLLIVGMKVSVTEETMSSKKRSKKIDPVDTLQRLVRLIDCLPFHYQSRLLLAINEIQEDVLALMRECTDLRNENHQLMNERVRDLEETVETLRNFKRGVLPRSPDNGEKN
jgi:hypothetical protein